MEAELPEFEVMDSEVKRSLRVGVGVDSEAFFFEARHDRSLKARGLSANRQVIGQPAFTLNGSPE